MDIKDFNNIDFSKYIGYYWNSDAEKPIQSNFKKISENTLPFVIEGYLYNEHEEISISVKNYNGKYIINQFDLNNIGENLRLSKEIEYPAYSSKLKGVKKLKFKELQEKMSDDNGFFVWEKVANIFVGFVK